MKTKGQELGEQYAGTMISDDFVQHGLTKREYFAIQIATGLSVQAIAGSHNFLENMSREVPHSAVVIADALLEKLAGEK